jgi:glycerophosphoryl diester phosphodiesterase
MIPRKKNVLVIAHRGVTYSGLPENSLPAFQAAIDEGYDGIELDVRLSRDKELIVIHDIRLERLTENGRGMVRTKMMSALRQLKIRNEYVDTFIPRLSEVMELMRNSDLLINIEIKSEMPMRGRIEQRVIDCVYRYGLRQRVVLSSFNPLVIKKIQKIDPTIRTAFLFEKRLPKFNQRLASGLIVDSWHPNHKGVTALTVEKAHSLSCRVFPWTVNEEKEIHRMLGLGVDGMITDVPHLVKRIITSCK